jgi:hypothetical protein
MKLAALIEDEWAGVPSVVKQGQKEASEDMIFPKLIHSGLTLHLSSIYYADSLLRFSVCCN